MSDWPARSRLLRDGPGHLRTTDSGIGIVRGARIKRDAGRHMVSASIVTMDDMEVVLRTRTPEGVEVILTALVYAKILEEHSAVADLDLIDRTIREPDERRSDRRPGRERFFRREGDLWVLAVVDFEGVPAIIVTVFSTERSPT